MHYVVADVTGEEANFSGARMPQHLDADPSNDLPLGAAPDTWLPGFSTEGLAGYEALPVTIDEVNKNRAVTAMQTADAAAWSSVKRSQRRSRVASRTRLLLATCLTALAS